MDSSGGNVRAFGRAVRNRWRRSFVASITLLALLGVVAFAFVIGRIVKAQIEDQAFDRAKDTARQFREGYQSEESTTPGDSEPAAPESAPRRPKPGPRQD